jgi:hypothetical protein
VTPLNAKRRLGERRRTCVGNFLIELNAEFAIALTTQATFELLQPSNRAERPR